MGNPLIQNHNEKVEQFHELVEWFENEYKDSEELCSIIQNIKDSAIQLGKLVESK